MKSSRFLTSFRSLVAAIPEKLHSESGQGMVEYGLIIVLIAIIVIVTLTLVGNQVKNAFSNISAGLISH
jgi:pilus assembly protein Flp/PilA